MPIRILDAATVGRIAAGEVVERPSSVVKELMENSIDAGATAITVEIKGGGIDYLRVTDNGCGIEPNQVRLAFENHATSKLQSAEQLDDIRTLGFRGEALPSIASVSHVEMSTRARGQDSGVRLNIDGGEKLRVQEVGCPEGTTFIMKDLFYNIPVRRAFLKKPAYEGALVSDTVARMLLGNPGVSVRFINNGQNSFHSFGDGSLRHAVFAVYGKEAAEQMVALDASEGGTRIHGLIGVGELARSSRAHQAFFINGRAVRCATLTKALEEVCRTRVTIGLYPMCVLNVVIPPASVNVNVHPNKLEVRFKDEAMMRQTAERLMAQAFEGERVLRLDAAAAPRTVERVATVREITPAGVVTSEAQAPEPDKTQPPEPVASTTADSAPEANPAGSTAPDMASEAVSRAGDCKEEPRRMPVGMKPPKLREPGPMPIPFAENLKEPGREAVRPVGAPEPDAAAAGSGTDGEAPPADRPSRRERDPKLMEQSEYLEACRREIDQAMAKLTVSDEGEMRETPDLSAIPFVAWPDGVTPWDEARRRARAQASQVSMPDVAGSPEKPEAYRVIGVLFKTYILIEANDSLMLIDQHAAHERLNYERLMAGLEAGRGAQQLLTPMVVRLSAREMALVRDNMEVLAEAGYEVEPFGERDVQVRAVPFILGKADLKPAFMDAIGALDRVRLAAVELRRAEIMQMSCKAAVKGGDALGAAEIESLIQQMLETGAPPTCPHGRPVVKAISRREIEKMFKRIQ